MVERYVYDPFGASQVYDATWHALSASGVDWQYRHQGLRLDLVTGTYYNRHREYSPTLGRFIQVDPIRFEAGDVNLYRYVGNGVTGRVDPSGLESNEPKPGTQIPATITRITTMGNVHVNYRIGHHGTPGSKIYFGVSEVTEHVTLSSVRMCNRDIRKDPDNDKVVNALIPVVNNVAGHQALLDERGFGYGLQESKSKAGQMPDLESPREWKTTNCKLCQLTTAILQYGKGAGKTGKQATDEEIWDCIKNAKYKKDYSLLSYNCYTWSNATAKACGLSCHIKESRMKR